MLTDAGIWVSDRPAVAGPPRRGLLLDRDGVLVRETNYLHRPEDVALEPGALELLAWARQRGVPACVTTNQAGVARNLYTWADYCAVEGEIDRRLADHGLSLDLSIACPFHPDFTAGYGEDHAWWRKPGPGMLFLAAQRLALDLSRSWMIGDKQSDIAAARAAGLQGAIHVLTGHGAAHAVAAVELDSAGFAVIQVPDLFGAIGALKTAWPEEASQP